MYEMWHSLSLAVPPGGGKIEVLLKGFWGEERLSDGSCDVDGCRVRGRRVLITEAWRWPRVLIVHLKRWVVMREPVFSQRKVVDYVDYEMLLPADAGRPVYHLRGVVVHHGDVGGGHYTSIVRASDNSWYLCDDGAYPTPIPAEHALRQQAMLLVYEV